MWAKIGSGTTRSGSAATESADCIDYRPNLSSARPTLAKFLGSLEPNCPTHVREPPEPAPHTHPPPVPIQAWRVTRRVVGGAPASHEPRRIRILHHGQLRAARAAHEAAGEHAVAATEAIAEPAAVDDLHREAVPAHGLASHAAGDLPRRVQAGAAWRGIRVGHLRRLAWRQAEGNRPRAVLADRVVAGPHMAHLAKEAATPLMRGASAVPQVACVGDVGRRWAAEGAGERGRLHRAIAAVEHADIDGSRARRAVRSTAVAMLQDCLQYVRGASAGSGGVGKKRCGGISQNADEAGPAEVGVGRNPVPPAPFEAATRSRAGRPKLGPTGSNSSGIGLI